MKNIGKLGLALALTLATSMIFAQTEAKKGNYSFLKGEKQLNLEFVYDGMKVGKNLTEEEYVNKKVEEHNNAEAGKGDKWKEGWISARKERYEPKFEELINKSMESCGIVATQGTSFKYTLVVTTTYTEPGFNIGVMKQPASCNFSFTFKDDSNKEVATYILERVPGSQVTGYDFDAGSRLAECYAKAGKMLGAYISKALK